MAKQMHSKLAEIKQQLRRRLHERMREVGVWLHKVMQGFYNYHAVPGNLRRLWCDIGCCTRGGVFAAAAVSYACRGTATFHVFGRGCPNPECSIPIPTRVFAPHTQGEPHAGRVQVRIRAGGDELSVVDNHMGTRPARGSGHEPGRNPVISSRVQGQGAMPVVL